MFLTRFFNFFYSHDDLTEALTFFAIVAFLAYLETTEHLYKSALKAFCEYWFLKPNSNEYCGTNIEGRRIAKTIHGRSTEVFFISTTEVLIVTEKATIYPPAEEGKSF